MPPLTCQHTVQFCIRSPRDTQTCYHAVVKSVKSTRVNLPLCLPRLQTGAVASTSDTDNTQRHRTCPQPHRNTRLPVRLDRKSQQFIWICATASISARFPVEVFRFAGICALALLQTYTCGMWREAPAYNNHTHTHTLAHITRTSLVHKLW